MSRCVWLFSSCSNPSKQQPNSSSQPPARREPKRTGDEETSYRQGENPRGQETRRPTTGEERTREDRRRGDQQPARREPERTGDEETSSRQVWRQENERATPLSLRAPSLVPSLFHFPGAYLSQGYITSSSPPWHSCAPTLKNVSKAATALSALRSVPLQSFRESKGVSENALYIIVYSCILMLLQHCLKNYFHANEATLNGIQLRERDRERPRERWRDESRSPLISSSKDTNSNQTHRQLRETPSPPPLPPPDSPFLQRAHCQSNQPPPPSPC